MQIRKHTKNLFAIILLVLLVQKVAGGLFIHTWLHEQHSETAPVKSSGYGSTKCSCIDDFNVLFEQPADLSLATISPLYTELNIPPVSSKSADQELYILFRGPPAV